MLWQPYIDSAIENIYHLSIVEEWKTIMDNSYYENNLHKCVYIPYENR